MNKITLFVQDKFEFVLLMSICFSLLGLFAVEKFALEKFTVLSYEKPLVQVDYVMINNLPFTL